MARRVDPELKVRFPGDLKQRLAQAAAKNSRSLNSEIVQLLEDALRRSTTASSPATSDQEIGKLIVDMHKVLMSWNKSSLLWRGPPDRAPEAGVVPPAPTFVANIKKAKARGVERGGEFVVLAGSTALRRETDTLPQNVKDARKALIDAGVLVPDADNDLYRFAQDASFGSPSGASGAIAARTDNGHKTWRVEGSGQSYSAWRSGLIGDGGAA